MPQGSVLRPTLFLLVCNDLLEIIEDCDGEIHIYADDTTIYVAASSPDMVALALNVLFQKLYSWCCLNCLTPQPGKTECTILMHGQFVRPLQAVLLGNRVVTQVNPTKCLGIEIDSDLNRNVYVKELIKVFIQKLNLVWSLYFLPTTAITDFYFKVILPSVTYGLVV